MTEHYYSREPSSESRPLEFSFESGGITLNIKSDKGVFSYGEADMGSMILIRTLPELHGEVLDMGCGYGIIGLYAAKRNPSAHITMADINSRAVSLAKENAEKNRIKNVTVVQSDGFDEISGTYDAIITNPPIRAGKAVIYKMFRDAFKSLKNGGALYIVIRKQQGAMSAKAELESIFGECETLERKAGYRVFCCIKKDPSAADGM